MCETLHKHKLTAARKWVDSRHLCGVPLLLLWPLLFPPCGLSYCFNVVVLWIHLWGFSSRANVKIVLGTSVCLSSCFVIKLLAWPYSQKRNIFCIWCFAYRALCNVGLETLYGAYALTRISFWCELYTLMTILPCWSLVCSCYGDSSKGGGIPFFPQNQWSWCHLCVVKSFSSMFFLVFHFWNGKDLQDNWPFFLHFRSYHVDFATKYGNQC